MGERNVQQELRELRARYEALVEHAPEALVILNVETGRFDEVNQRACSLFRMTREQLTAVGPAEMSPEFQPDGRPSGQAAMEQVKRAVAGQTPVFEWTHRDSEGRLLPCRLQLARIPSDYQMLVRGSIRDISDEKAAEGERARLHAIMDATPDLVGMSDAEGRVLYLNPAFFELLKIPEGTNPIGQSISSLHPERWSRFILAEALPAAIRDGIWRGETAFVARDGTEIPVSQVIIAHRDAAGNVEYLSTIARDIRDRLAAAQLERKMLQAQKLESLGVLAGGIAHDFNNLLVGILTNASLGLADYGEHPGIRELLTDIQEAGRRAAELANQMLDYAGKRPGVRTPLDLEELMRQVSRLVSASISKSARLSFDFGPDVPPVLGDASQLRQVVMNLIINASDALGDEPGTIVVRTACETVRPERLRFSALPADADGSRCVMLEVRDSGRGIDAPVDRIFEPFFTTKFTGRGLGLAAVMGIVQAHGGGIDVETEPGAGTVFRLWFQAHDGERVARDQALAAPQQEAPTRGAVLVIDDELVVRQALSGVLRRLGFEVIAAAGGREGIAEFRERADSLVAAIVDLTMPEMSGFAVLEQLRAIRGDVPVVLTSGYSDAAGVDKAEAFLRKPFSLEEVRATFETILPAESR